MDLQKGKSSARVPSLSMAPFSILNKVPEKTQLEKEEKVSGYAVATEVDIDLREVYFLIMHFLSSGPCQKTSTQFLNELMEHQLLPRRYHAWFSRNGACSGQDEDDGFSLPMNYVKLVQRYPHIQRDHLVKLLKQLIVNAAPPLLGNVGRNAPSAADVPTLLGTGSFSLLNRDKRTENKKFKLPLYLRWPHMQADQVHGLGLREIGGGFSKHHHAPSIRSACYAIAKPSIVVQKMDIIKKLRGHRDAVYCAIFDRSGRYIITGSDDRLVKIWSMETALSLASCRGHEGDITDLAVSSNNILVASASNDFVIRVWRLPDGLPISVLKGHNGAVTAIAFNPKPNAAHHLLSSSDDGTCRIWDARSSQTKPRIYAPKPPESSNGKSNGPSNNGPSSSNIPQNHQILCCAFNANGTVFVTGSSDTFARVWSAFKFYTDDLEKPIHEMDVLAGHENDVNYVQFSGCAVASKSSLSDSLKEESFPRLKNSWFCHDNIVTCSRDGSAIIWVPRSRKSHGKVGRWTRAYHLKVPPPPLPPQPSRGGPRQRCLPTPRGVNMIVWSLDNRFVLAAIMDCRICVWNAVDGSLVHCLTGHSASSYVLDVHPFNPRIAMSAGYDGLTIVWDIWEGTPIRVYKVGQFKLVDGKFSADGTSIVLSDDVGQIYMISTGQGESQKDAKYDQFFLGDYRPVIRDTSGGVYDQETQLLAHKRNIQDPLCDSTMIPYPEPYQSMYQQRRLGALGIEWRPSTIKFAVGPDFTLGLGYEMPPLADLERMVEPLPEITDAMFWEPEIEVMSEDSDSEYHVTEENSSVGEKGSISISSFSDSDDSSDDGEAQRNHKDSLFRSRRKKHKVKPELVTTSGRRVKKRNVDEADGSSSGSKKSKRPRTGSKVSKRKLSKSKILRPQRVAASNARHMFSRITEASTDEEGEDDSEYASSDSKSALQCLSIQSADADGEVNMHQTLTREEEPLVDVPKPPTFSESQSNVGNRKRLVLKFSLRDSKKQAPLEDIKPQSNNDINLACPSSSPQEVTLEKRFERSSKEQLSTLTDGIDMEQSQSINETVDAEQAENDGNHLGAFASEKENKIRWGEFKMRTSKRSRSGDLSSGFSSSPYNHEEKENDVDTRPENKYGHFSSYSKVKNHVGTCAQKELDVADLGCASKSSLLESSPLSQQKLKGIISAGSYYGNLKEGCEGQSASGKCLDGASEIKKDGCIKTTCELKENVPFKSKKIIIKTKKGILRDPQSPLAPKSATSLDNSGSPGFDLINEIPSNMRHDLNLEVTETAGDACRSSYSQLSRKARTNTEGSDGDLEESIYTTGLCSSGVDLPEDATDAIRRSRSLKMKATSRETNTMKSSFKARESHKTGMMSRDTEYSSQRQDQLHGKSRSTRNYQGPYNGYNQSLSTHKMLNNLVGRLSWLMMSEHEEGYRYIPQLGDEVVYLKQGHQEYTELNNLREGPWRSIKNLSAVEICMVEALDYDFVPGSGDSRCKMKLKFVDPFSNAIDKLFQLTLPELSDFADFVVERTWYDAAIKRNWTCRDKCLVWWRHENGEGGRWWNGRIKSVQAKSSEFPDSPWLRYVVEYKDDPANPRDHCPWELHDPDISWEHPCIDSESIDKLLSYFSRLEKKDTHTIQQMNHAVRKSDFCNRFPVPLYPELIKSRLQNNYYRSLKAVQHDVKVMVDNALSYFGKKDSAKIIHLQDWFMKKLSRCRAEE